MSIKTRHCTLCTQELSYTNGYAEEIFYFCQNRECILKGVQQIGIEAFDELIGVKELENSLVCGECNHFISMHKDDEICYDCQSKDKVCGMYQYCEWCKGAELRNKYRKFFEGGNDDE